MESCRPTDKIFIIVEDLFFLSRILETARRLKIRVESLDPVQLEERLAEEVPPGIILDMNHRSGKAVEILESIKRNGSSIGVPVLGFLSHVQSDLARAARDAGCDLLLARSAFSQQLPELLQKLSGRN